MSGPIAEALAARPDLAERYADFRSATHTAFGEKRTTMVRQVIAQVHGCPIPDGTPPDPDLADWRSSSRFTCGERAWLAYAERIPFEHTAIADDEAEAVVAELGEAGYVAFSLVAALADAECRAAMVDLPSLTKG